MAPQQELEKLIGESKKSRSGQYTTDEDGEDHAHVVIVQPEEDQVGHAENKEKGSKMKGKPGTGGPEQPKNCRQLETALFFFGISGMIVSLIMLLQHFAMKMITYS